MKTVKCKEFYIAYITINSYITEGNRDILFFNVRIEIVSPFCEFIMSIVHCVKLRSYIILISSHTNIIFQRDKKVGYKKRTVVPSFCC